MKGFVHEGVHDGSSTGSNAIRPSPIIITKATQARPARLAAAPGPPARRRKSLLSRTMPGKLADCPSTDPTLREIFIARRTPGRRGGEAAPRSPRPQRSADPAQDPQRREGTLTESSRNNGSGASSPARTGHPRPSSTSTSCAYHRDRSDGRRGLDGTATITTLLRPAVPLHAAAGRARPCVSGHPPLYRSMEPHGD